MKNVELKTMCQRSIETGAPSPGLFDSVLALSKGTKGLLLELSELHAQAVGLPARIQGLLADDRKSPAALAKEIGELRALQDVLAARAGRRQDEAHLAIICDVAAALAEAAKARETAMGLRRDRKAAWKNMSKDMFSGKHRQESARALTPKLILEADTDYRDAAELEGALGWLLCQIDPAKLAERIESNAAIYGNRPRPNAAEVARSNATLFWPVLGGRAFSREARGEDWGGGRVSTEAAPADAAPAEPGEFDNAVPMEEEPSATDNAVGTVRASAAPAGVKTVKV